MRTAIIRTGMALSLLAVALTMALTPNAAANHDYVEECDNTASRLLCAWAGSGWGTPARCTVSGGSGSCEGNFEWWGGGWRNVESAFAAEVTVEERSSGAEKVCFITTLTPECETTKGEIWVENCAYTGISPVQARAMATTHVTGEPHTGWTDWAQPRCEEPL